jgi:hypothetical protein
LIATSSLQHLHLSAIYVHAGIILLTAVACQYMHGDCFWQHGGFAVYFVKNAWNARLHSVCCMVSLALLARQTSSL